jgi:hydrogenase maturation protease
MESRASTLPACRTLVIGLGNPILSDDSVGLRVVRSVRQRLEGRWPDVDFAEDHWGGLRLMERMIGRERAIVVDAIRTGARPGTIHLLTTDSIPTQMSASAHDLNLPTALAFGRRAGARLPQDDCIRLVAIEVLEVETFGEGCTPCVARAIPRAVRTVIRLLGSQEGGLLR